MNIHFGFSYIGLIFLLMLMLPNIIWSKNKPKGYDKYVKNENKVLLLLEWLGEMLVTCLSLIFSDFNINKISNWSSILLIAFIIMILYEIYWIQEEDLIAVMNIMSAITLHLEVLVVVMIKKI